MCLIYVSYSFDVNLDMDEHEHLEQGHSLRLHVPSALYFGICFSARIPRC